MWYFLIGLIYGIASCLKYLTMMNKLTTNEKLISELRGDCHWFVYIVIFISRFLFWPAYLIMSFVN